MANKFTKQTWPMMNELFDWVREELNNRKHNIYSGTNGMSEIRTPFIRLTSGLTRQNQTGELFGNSRFLTLGLHGYRAQGNIFNLSYGNKDIVGYAHEMSGDSNNSPEQIKVSASDPLVKANATLDAKATTIVHGTHPVPGITRVSVTRLAVQPSRASIDWVCYNLSQLEYLRHYFLTPGIICVLDWGHMMDKDSNILTNQNMINFHQSDIDSEIADYIADGKSKLYEKYISKSKGNYDVFIGLISNFNFSFDAPNQRYLCTTQLMSSSEIFYGISTDHTAYTSDVSKTPYQTTLHQYFNSENGGFMRKVIADSVSKTKIVTDFEKLKTSAGIEQTEPDNIGIKKEAYEKTVDQSISLSFGEVPPRDGEGHTYQPQSQPGQYYSKSNAEISLVSNREDNYITFLYFLNVILPDFAASSNTNLLNYIDKLKFNYWNEPLVSYSDGKIGNRITRGLLTLDPSVCLLIDINYPNNRNLNENFKKSTTFVTTTNDKTPAGQLSSGVWLNTKKIMECMMAAQNLSDGLQSILDNVSNSTGNFWKLRIAHNDHLDIYQIIDEGHRSSAYDIDNLQKNAYKFNEGTKGELLSIDFNATLSNEQASQIIFSSLRPPQDGDASKTIFDFFSKMERVNSIGISNPLIKYKSDITIGKDLFAKATIEKQRSDRSNMEVNESSAPSIDPNLFNTFYDLKGDGTKTPSDVIGLIADKAGQGSAGSIRIFDEPSTNSNIGPVKSSSAEIVNKDVNTLNPEFRTKLGKVINRMKTLYGHQVDIVETSRSQERQQWLFDQGRNRPGNIVTWTLNSNHKSGNAADVIIDGNWGSGLPYVRLSQIATEEGLHTLGDKDPGHLELIGASSVFTQSPQVVASNEQKKLQSEKILEGQKKEEIEKATKTILGKFGQMALIYTDVSKDSMLNRIICKTNSDETTASKSRNITGFPAITPNEISIEMVGISGIIGSDVFLVDKIPESFNAHGMFQTFEVTHTIEPQSGWKTKLRGRWMMTKPFTEE